MSRTATVARSSPHRPPCAWLTLVCAALLAALALPAWAGKGAAAAVGQVLLAAGEVWRVQGEQREPLQRGQSVREGDTLLTGDGQLIVRMDDQALLSLRQGSRLLIENYRNTADLERAVVRLRLEEGTLRSASGSVGKPRFRLNTPFSALGIRGTDFVTRVADGRQEVHVESGAVAVALFDAAGCSAAGLGECAGVATVLAAGSNRTLALDAAARSVALREGVADALRPAAAERELFPAASAARGGVGERTDILAVRRLPVTDGRAFDASGRALEPFAVSERRILAELVDTSRLRGIDRAIPGISVESPLPGLTPGGSPEAIRRFADGFLLRQLADLDGDGLTDLTELAGNTLPWRADTDGDGIADGLDPQPRVAAQGFRFDGSAAAVTEAVFRSRLTDTTARLSSFDFGAFGRAGFYQLRANGDGASLSLWFDPAHRQFWGVGPVVQSLLDARDLPEGRAVWSSMPSQLAGLATDAQTWLSRLALGATELWALPLGNQVLQFEPRAELPAGGGRYKLDFVQLLAAGAPGDAAPRPLFVTVTDRGGRFDIDYVAGGVAYSVSGVSSANGLLTADDGVMQARGQRAADGSLLLLVGYRVSGGEYALGLSPAGIAVDPRPAALQARTVGTVDWGRWSDFAQLSAADVQRLLGPAVPGESRIAHGRYALQAPVPGDLPARGAFEFAMSGHEAIYSDAGGIRPASLSNGYLQVDFDRRRFVSAFDASAPGVALTHVRGAGTLEAAGRLVSQLEFSNARLDGVLGPGAASASLLFERPVDAAAQFAGITHWAR